MDRRSRLDAGGVERDRERDDRWSSRTSRSPAWIAAQSSSGQPASSSSSPTRISRTSRSDARSCKAKRASRPSRAASVGTRAGRNDDQLLGMRQRNDRAVPSDAGAAGVLPRMFPVAQVRGRGRRLVRPIALQIEGHARAWPFLLPRTERFLTASQSDYYRVRVYTPPQRNDSSHASNAPVRPSTSGAMSFQINRSGSAVVSAILRVLRRRARAADGAPGAGAQAPPPMGVVTHRRSQKKPIEQASGFIATIRSLRSSTVQPEVEGVVTRIFVKSGDRVALGAPLVQIKPDKQQATVRSTRGQSRRGRGRRAVLARNRSSGSSRWWRPARSAARNSIRRRIRCARPKRGSQALNAQVNEQQVELQYYRVSAPQAGVVGDIADSRRAIASPSRR